MLHGEAHFGKKEGKAKKAELKIKCSRLGKLSFHHLGFLIRHITLMHQSKSLKILRKNRQRKRVGKRLCLKSKERRGPRDQ